MFAPPQWLPPKLARVLPGERLRLTAFTDAGAGGDFFRTLGAHLPPPPFAENPLGWGDPARPRCSRVSRSSFEPPRTPGASNQARRSGSTTTFGPIVALGGAALAADLQALFERQTDGSTRVPYDYLVTLTHTLILTGCRVSPT